MLDVEGLPGLVDDVVVLENIVLDLGGQLVEFCDSDAHVETSEDVAQILIAVHPVVLSLHLSAQYPSCLLLLLLYLQFGFNMTIALLRQVFRVALLVEAISCGS